MIREFFEKRRIRKAFSQYLAPEVINKLLTQPPSDIRALRAAQIDFVCVSVRGDTPQIISERMGLVCDAAVQYEGSIHEIISGIVVIAYGLFETEIDSKLNRNHLCESLKAQLGENIKIVHGTAAGHFGNIGGERRVSFSFIVPGFLDALAALAALPYGEIRELKNSEF